VQPIYLRYADLSISKYKYNIRSAKERPHVTSSDRGERGFVGRFTFSSYTIWRSKYTISDKVTPLWKCICEPPEIQIGGYWGDSRSTASLGLITRFMLIAYNRRGLCQRCTGAGVSEWPPAGVLTNFENRSGAGVVFWIWG